MHGRWSAGLIATTLALLALAGSAQAADPAITIGPDGRTAATFSYTDAIRQRVFIPVPGVDQDRDGVDDRTAIDIMRPKESDEGLKVPAIIDPSPYYTTLGRGNESQRIEDTDGDGLNDKWPLFYDNFFVPRGYAVILADMDGTGNSTGCPEHGGPGDIASMKVVVDWLNGRAPGFDKDGNAVTAPWHSGKAAMIGKSYDGTLANGVAATGVDGLTTIVPISAIADWYDYSRMGGIRFMENYPGNGLASQITNPDRLQLCAPSRTTMNNTDGDENGDINDFWAARAYTTNIGNVKASVFASHGLQDDNVKMDHLSKWWAGLKAHNVPRKLWLTRTGHEDPFDYRRGQWVDTLHRWFDHWLVGVDNGIMSEPQVDIEASKDTFVTYSDWPAPDAADVDVYLRGTTQATAGDLGLSSGGDTDTLSWIDSPGQTENGSINNPTGVQTTRRVFLSPALTHDLHISGTMVVDIQASLDKPQSNLGAVLVDYGAGTQITRTSEGIQNVSPVTESCWGQSSANDDACYIDVVKPTVNVTQWRITKGILDSSNRDSLVTGTPVNVGEKYRFTWPTHPQDYVIPAGHQLGIVLVANYQNFGSFSSTNGTTGTTVTLDTRVSKVRLPVVGGYRAAVASGAFAADTVAPELHGVPANISVDTDSGTGRTVTYTPPTATDNEDPAPVVECDPPSGANFAVGTTDVVCTATDASGNQTNATFTVTVRWVVDDPGDVDGDVPGTLSLTVGGGAASLGAFTPGVARDYLGSLSANVISTAESATLSVADPDTVNTGHLVNGAFALPSVLQVNATSPIAGSGAFAPLGGSSAPTTLLTYGGPVSNDPVTLGFKQSIGAADALRTGTYSKTLTFTLSTTAP
ncbi:MAG TPA: CocE/NonD family hydrolase [Solirubrobacteraceae bacterium]|nr:CocE/NonD family hydrolase [Solirubrobacteraceae bacterium]